MKQLSLIFLFSLQLYANAQKKGQALADSAMAELQKTTGDSNRVILLNIIASYYAKVNTDTAFKYAAAGMQLAQKMGWQTRIGKFHICYGNIFTTKGELDSANGRYNEALLLFGKLKDKANLAGCYNNLGSVANAKSDYVTSVKYFSRSLEIGEEIKNDYYISAACTNLSILYLYQKNYATGLGYAKRSLAIARSNDNQEVIPTALSMVAGYYQEMKNFDSAYSYFRQALEQVKTGNNKVVEAMIISSFGKFYAAKGDYANAIDYALRARSLWNAVGPDYRVAIANTGALGTYYLAMAKDPATADKTALLKLAKACLEEAIRKHREKGQKGPESEYFGSLAEVNALMGDYRNAYLNYKNYKETQDSIFSQENKNKIAATVNQLEIDKKNAVIALNDLTIKTQRRQRLYFIAGLLALVIIGSLLYWQIRVGKRTNSRLLALNKRLDEGNKIKAKFFAILSHDLRSPIASLVNLLHLQKNEPALLDSARAAIHQQRIAGKAEFLLETMEAMLLWSKGQMENFKPAIKKVAVSDLFQYLHQFFHSVEKVALSYNDPQNILLDTDENYLLTIMQNLTSNAIQAVRTTRDAAVKWEAKQEGGIIILSISDNGPGLDEARSSALYENAVAANSRTGLGLHLIKDLAKAINYTIAVRSSPGAGTTFSILIRPGIT